MARKNKRLKSFFTAIIVLVVLSAGYFAFDKTGNGLFEKEKPIAQPSGLTVVRFLDVGQGDSTLIMLPDGKTVLIDAANPEDGEKVVEYLKETGIEKIDYLIATHPHADHIGGIAEVIEKMEIGAIFAPKVAEEDIPSTTSYENFLLAVKEKGLKITEAVGNEVLFEGEEYRAECYSPLEKKYNNLNDYSIVLMLVHGENKFLFTGDAEKTVEKQILSEGFNPSCTVLKVAHHGSSGSCSKEFLEAASPKYAVISCGTNNSYGHPHKETLRAFEKLNSFEKLYRTDTEGTITAVSDGKGNVTFETGGKKVA